MTQQVERLTAEDLDRYTELFSGIVWYRQIESFGGLVIIICMFLMCKK